MSGKRTPEELWKALEKERDVHAQRPGSSKVSDVERELADAGLDVEAEKAEARAWSQGLSKGGAPSKPPESLAQVRSLRPPPRRSLVPWIAAAAAIVLVGGGWLYERLAPEAPSDPPPIAAARSLRRQALDACQANQWQKCLDRFDEAKALDSAGDTDLEVKAQRAKATQALALPK